MSQSATCNDIPLPKSWPKYIKSAMIHVISLAHVAVTYSRGWAANSRIRRVQLSAELDEAQNESSLLREELRIKDARMGRIPPRKRPFYTPVERMAILELRAARGWNLSDTAKTFMVEADTISSWMGRSSDQDDPLVQVPVPANKYPDFVRYVVQRLKVLCPRMGKKRIAQILTKAGLHLATTTVDRILKQDPLPEKPNSKPIKQSKPRRMVTARYRNHVWHVDLTIVPTTGLWVPWMPFTLPQVWPFCWWVAVIEDQFSRMLMGFSVFLKEPTSQQILHMFAEVIKRVGEAPKYLISDQGPQFFSDSFREWCKRRTPSIRQRFGAVGQYGSIAIIERFIRSLKNELFAQYRASTNIDRFRTELAFYATWYNQYRPHQGLGGRIPADVYFGEEQEVAPLITRGPDAREFQIVISFLKGRRHLPVVGLQAAA